MRYLGAHVSAAGGMQNAIHQGDKYSINSIQTMFSAPIRWATKEIPQDQIEAMADALEGSHVEKILFHGIYLINLARKEKQKFHLSKMSVVTHLDAVMRLEKALKERGNSQVEVLGLTFHPGSAIDLEPEEAIKRISYGLDWITDKVPNGKILLETSAGAGNIMGDKLEELAAMREGVADKSRIGYVLDTQHMFVSGYDWKNKLEEVIENIDKTIGVDLVKSFHLNDSMTQFASNKDRHANLGEGEIGEKAIKELINHPKLKHIPFMLETPAMKKPTSMAIEIEKLKKWAQD